MHNSASFRLQYNIHLVAIWTCVSSDILLKTVPDDAKRVGRTATVEGDRTSEIYALWGSQGWLVSCKYWFCTVHSFLGKVVAVNFYLSTDDVIMMKTSLLVDN